MSPSRRAFLLPALALTLACGLGALAPRVALAQAQAQPAAAAAGTVLVTGASRGIGFEFVRQYAEAGWTVIATARRPQESKNLIDLAAQHRNVGAAEQTREVAGASLGGGDHLEPVCAGASVGHYRRHIAPPNFAHGVGEPFPHRGDAYETAAPRHRARVADPLP